MIRHVWKVLGGVKWSDLDDVDRAVVVVCLAVMGAALVVMGWATWEAL